MKDDKVTDSFVESSYIFESSITESEVRKVLNDLKTSKAADADGIPAELLKATGREGLRVIAAV